MGSAVSVALPAGAMLNTLPDAVLTMDKGVVLKPAFKFNWLSNTMRTMQVAATSPSHVLLGADAYGDTKVVTVGGHQQLHIVQSCYLASSATVAIADVVQNRGFMSTLVSGTGLIVKQTSGAGVVALKADGAIVAVQVQPGKPVRVDNGHVVAWTGGVRYEMKKAVETDKPGWMAWAQDAANSFLTEGYMCEFTGGGTVFIHTRKSLDSRIESIARRAAREEVRVQVQR